jgi:tetratricopeptide (TPR) repeat protein
MKSLVPIALAAALVSPVPDILEPLARKSNSGASAQRGREAFVEGRFEDAAREFGVAAGLRPEPAASFNVGTAKIAAGNVAGGLESLVAALDDETLVADVRYNAGWAALDAGEWTNAIRAYEEVLRERPGDANAKRNLEIALHLMQQQQQQPQPDAQPRPDDDEGGGEEPDPQGDDPPAGEPDVDSILRSVEQQEKEELERMRRSRRERKVDW